jgi:hypothetical protein
LAATGASVVVSYLAQEEKALHFVENIEDPSGNTMVVFVVINKEYEVGAIFREIFRPIGSSTYWPTTSVCSSKPRSRM